MDSKLSSDIELNDEDQNFDLLQDIERQTSDKIRKQRAHDRICIKTKVILQSGNSSDLLSFKIQGITGDVSEGGCRAMFPIPIQVGDIYRLQFDREQLDVPLVFARCMRCKLVREDAYEAGFSFFSPLKILVHSKSAVGDELL
jgi:hypothetical protein